MHFIFRSIPSLNLKLTEMAIVHVLGTVDDECCFSFLAFPNIRL
jgi:hypothetical protein